MLWETVKLAMSSIRRNVLRSVLTLLGIVIGVGAVIAMVTLGNGASSKVQENLAKLGSNMLIVRPGQSTFGPGGTSDARAFDERDVAALKNNLTGIKGVAPTAQKQAKTVYGSLNYDTSVTGTNSDWFAVQDWTLADGRVFSDSELRAGASVCVIGATITRELFGAQDPIGERLRIGNFSCEVIATMARIPPKSVSTDDKTQLQTLDADLKRVVFGQDAAIEKLSSAIKLASRARSVAPGLRAHRSACSQAACTSARSLVGSDCQRRQRLEPSSLRRVQATLDDVASRLEPST